MRNTKKSLLGALLSFTVLCGCAASASNHEASAAGINALKERGIPSERAGQKTPVIALRDTLMSQNLIQTENLKQTDAKLGASVSSAARSSKDRPGTADFDWVNKVTNIWDVPTGAKVLSQANDVKGSWKVMLIGEDNDYYWFYSLLNMDFDFEKNNEDVTATADWYRSCEINKQNGESKTYDESVDADTAYTGSMLNGTVYVFDPVKDPYSRYLYVSGERILNFFIVNWYEKGGKQYGLGLFNSENASLGTVALVRDAGAVPTPTPAAQNTNVKWAKFADYWSYENDNDPENCWDDEHNSIYLKIADKDHAFLHVDDEMWGECIYDMKRVVYDEKTDILSLYNIEGGDLDAELMIDTYNGKEALFVVGHTEMPFTRTDKSKRGWLNWDTIEEDFREVGEYYDSLK